MQSKKLTCLILLAMVLGIATGYGWRAYMPQAEAIASFTHWMEIITTIFLRLIKMIIAPLVLTTLIAGVAKMGDTKAIGRIGIKTLSWFIFASIISLSLGLMLVNTFQPGIGLDLALPASHLNSGIEKSSLGFADFVTHAVPQSVISAMANNEILQIVVFALFFGSATAAMGEKAKPLIDIIDTISHIMLKITGYVMNLAPFAVFAAIAAIVAKEGLGVLLSYSKFIGVFYLGMCVLWIVLALLTSIFIKKKVWSLLSHVKEPTLLALTTASSEAAYPKTLEQLERFGVSNKIASFVLPMGYSFNLDGSMLYCSISIIFIAQAYGMDLSLGQEISMLLILMLTSKGMAGVPRASLVVVAATLPQFHIPEAGLLLLIGIDHFLDMGRSATNVIGNSLATAVVAKWENEILHPHEPEHPAIQAIETDQV